MARRDSLDLYLDGCARVRGTGAGTAETSYYPAVLGLSTLIFVYNMIASWRGGPRAGANPWRALTMEWQVSSPPPVFNFDRIPTVVGGPYEYGVPGAVHGIFEAETKAEKVVAGGGSGHPPDGHDDGGGGSGASGTRIDDGRRR